MKVIVISPLLVLINIPLSFTFSFNSSVTSSGTLLLLFVWTDM
jgi:hypothetical protein